jgi:hypothetical protein
MGNGDSLEGFNFPMIPTAAALPERPTPGAKTKPSRAARRDCCNSIRGIGASGLSSSPQLGFQPFGPLGLLPKQLLVHVTNTPSQ